MLFPVTIVDNFFKDPDYIVNYAKSLDYEFTGVSPGARTKGLHEINYPFFNWTTVKALKLLYPDKNLKFNADVKFQRIPVNLEHDGWVHSDEPAELVIIVYLSKNNEVGTSFYRRKDKLLGKMVDRQDKKYGYFLNPHKNKKEIEKAKKQNNDGFEETINVKGVYNRCIMFDGSLLHAAHVFKGDPKEEDRLILITNLISMTNKDDKQIKYPIVECNRY